MKFLVPVAFIVSAGLGGLYAVKHQVQRSGNQETAGEIQVGSEVPDLKLQVFGGEPKQLSALGAKVTLINFWATWCEACMVEMPSIVSLQKAYKDRGFQVVALNVDEKPEAVLPKVLKQFGIDFPVYIETDGSISERFDVHAIPLTVILDKNRKVLMIHNGELDWNSPEVRAKLERWLSG